RDGAGPEPARLVGPARGERPDEGEARRLLALLVGLQAHRESGRRELRPAPPAVLGAVQLGTEVAEVQRRVERAVARVLQESAHRIAEKADIARRLPPAAVDQEETLAGRHKEFFSHVPYPPESA